VARACTGRTIVLITHDLDDALRLGAKVVRLPPGR
jgi:ABC-type proline/glycine betaine transport system ATPase subunit